MFVYIFIGTVLSKINFLHQYTQGRCVFQRYLQAQLSLSAPSEEIPEQTE